MATIVALLLAFALIESCHTPKPPVASYKPSMHPMAYAQRLVKAKWHDPRQFLCLRDLWEGESHWSATAWNPVKVWQLRDGKWVGLHAFGIAQRVGEKSVNPIIQIDRGISYIENRYGFPCKAHAFALRNYWY